MKKLLLVCFALGFGLASFAQRSCDISVESVDKPDRIMAAGVSFPISFTIKNNGPDTIRANDTLIFYFRINNQINTNPLARSMNKEMASGDTMNVSFNIALNVNVNGAFEGDFCAIAWGMNRSDDSLKIETTTTFANNQACRKTFFGYNTQAENVNSGTFQSMLFPNPANLNTTLSYTIENSSNVNIRIMDMTGKVISTLVNGQQSAGVFMQEIQTANLANGVYFYTITVGERTETRKFIVQH